MHDAKEWENQHRNDGDSNDSHVGGKGGATIVAATCAPSHIRYPQDVSLLNKARKNADKLVDALHMYPTDGKKPHGCCKRARTGLLKYTSHRNRTTKLTRKAIRMQLRYLRGDLEIIEWKLLKTLTVHQTERLSALQTICQQQKYMHGNQTYRIPGCIVSVR